MKHTASNNIKPSPLFPVPRSTVTPIRKQPTGRVLATVSRATAPVLFPALLALLGACRLVTLDSLPQDVSSVYRAPQSPDASWYEPDFNDSSWERLNASRLAKQPNTIYLRIPFDAGSSAEFVTDVYLRFEETPNFSQAFLNGIELTPDLDIQRNEKVMGFRVRAGKIHREKNILALSFASNQTPQTPSIELVLPDEDSKQQITQGPYLLSPSATGITVAFETSIPCLASVTVNDVTFYEPPSVSLPSGKISGERRHHWITISDQQEGSRYEYAARCSPTPKVSGDILAKGSFSTAPNAEATVSIAALAPGAKLSPFANAATQAKHLSPDLVLLLGGALPSGLDRQAWNDLFRAGYGLFLRSATVSALSSYFAALGGTRNNATLFALPDSAAGIGRAYSQDYGVVHLVVVDADAIFNPKVKAWAKEDSQQARDRQQRVILVLSRNALSVSQERAGKSIDAVSEELSVDLVVATGKQGFEFGVSPKGVSYLLQGEPNDDRQFSLIEASPDGVWVRSYDAAGNVVDDQRVSQE
jgi:hypothetical protein